MTKILIVDDDVRMREGYKLLIARKGYDVSTADSGEVALKMLKTTSIDVVITDFNMGPDMNGLDLDAKLKVLHKGLPVMVHSACDLKVPDDVYFHVKSGDLTYLYEFIEKYAGGK